MRKNNINRTAIIIKGCSLKLIFKSLFGKITYKNAYPTTCRFYDYYSYSTGFMISYCDDSGEIYSDSINERLFNYTSGINL